jgi:hypothetical protein
MTIQFWKQLPADALGTLSCKPNNFGKRARKVINREVKMWKSSRNAVK